MREIALRSRPEKSATVDCREGSPRRCNRIKSVSVESNANRLAVRIIGGNCSASCSWWNVAQSTRNSVRNWLSDMSSLSTKYRRLMEGLKDSAPILVSLLASRRNATCIAIRSTLSRPSSRCKPSAIPACNMIWITVYIQRRRRRAVAIASSCSG
jgi:hypothetical protein